jgi:hypothetical protein
MPVQIGLSNGEKWVVEGDLDATVNAMSGPGDMYTVEGGGRRISSATRSPTSLRKRRAACTRSAGSFSARRCLGAADEPQLRPVLLCLQDRRLPLPRQILKGGGPRAAPHGTLDAEGRPARRVVVGRRPSRRGRLSTALAIGKA